MNCIPWTSEKWPSSEKYFKLETGNNKYLSTRLWRALLTGRLFLFIQRVALTGPSELPVHHLLVNKLFHLHHFSTSRVCFIWEQFTLTSWSGKGFEADICICIKGLVLSQSHKFPIPSMGRREWLHAPGDPLPSHGPRIHVPCAPGGPLPSHGTSVFMPPYPVLCPCYHERGRDNQSIHA